MSPAKLKVAFCNRPSWDNPLGGDGVQMLKTKEALEKNYVIEIDIITNPEQITDRYDIVHVFNYVTTNITRSFIEKAKSLKIPIASSSIYWDYSYIFSTISRFLFRRKFTAGTAHVLKTLARILSKTIGRPKLLTAKIKNDYQFFVKSSDIILPNSIEEANLLENFTGLKFKDKVRIVYNGYTPHSESDNRGDDSYNRYNLPSRYVLEVGRIETIKNQLNVVYALRNHPDIPIVFVGRPVEKHYYKKLLSLSKKRGNVYYIDYVPHDEMNAFYKNAALHILPSLRESPGLVSLESLSNGCPIIVSDERYTPVNTYFKDNAYIVDPLDIKSLEETILAAYNDQQNRIVPDSIRRFTWETAAAQTWEAYSIIRQRKESEC